MNKTELIAAVAERSGHTKHDTAIMMDAVFTVIEESLLNGSEVKVPGFGKFAVKHREARVGKDPRTGEEKEFPAKRVAVFRPAKPLKDALNDCDPLHIA